MALPNPLTIEHPDPWFYFVREYRPFRGRVVKVADNFAIRQLQVIAFHAVSQVLCKPLLAKAERIGPGRRRFAPTTIRLEDLLLVLYPSYHGRNVIYGAPRNRPGPVESTRSPDGTKHVAAGYRFQAF